MPLAPVVLVRGGEPLLVDRAATRLAALAKEHAAAAQGLPTDPDSSPRLPQESLEAVAFDTSQIEAAGYTRGMLDVLASPSLFGEHRHVLITGAEAASDAFIEDGLAYLTTAGHEVGDVTVVIRHEKGVRGKKLLDAIAKAGYPVVTCEQLKRDSDKVDFVKQELKDARRSATPAAVQALVEALGSDLRELASGCDQLIADTTGTITPDLVDKYYGGRVEATGFRVADAAVAGHTTEAVTLLRHALETGLDPVPLVAVLAMKLRALAKVSTVRGRGNPGNLGMAPWQVDRARRELRGWTPEGLATAITAVADADAQVKGEYRDPRFAVERAVLRICAAHGPQ
ncbi:MAG TPA: DNA polymerase III subunit delta [Ruania sp.]|nr:DNA polymerase III subunit delta [Ruania sp.]